MAPACSMKFELRITESKVGLPRAPCHGLGQLDRAVVVGMSMHAKDLKLFDK